ncbi:MAG: DUF4296 domain-containing protein [Muribaculaceae bacterium]|nr:DUF4296 domain-containing protein [Muribaculaceae bacterium]
MRFTTFGRIVLISLITAVSGCTKRPSGVVSDSRMAKVIAELEISEAWLNTSSSVVNDSQREAAKEYVLQKNGLTVAEFDSTMVWYGKNPDAYYEVCDKAQKVLAQLQKKTSGRNIVQESVPNLWPYSQMLRISPQSASDGVIFSIESNNEVPSGSALRFMMKFNRAVGGDAKIGVEYEDGVSEFISRRLSENMRIDITLYTDTGRVVKRVFGNIALNNLRHNIASWSDSIAVNVLPYDSTKYYSRHSQHVVVPARRKKKEVADSLRTVKDSVAVKVTD